MDSIASLKKEEQGSAASIKSYGSVGECNNNDDVNDNGAKDEAIFGSNHRPTMAYQKLLSFSVITTAFAFFLYTTVHVPVLPLVIPTGDNSNSVRRHSHDIGAIASENPATTSTSIMPSMSLANQALNPVFKIPFPQVDRADYGDPVSSFIQEDLFANHLRASPSNSQHNKFVFPFPTGAFWINFVLLSTADQGISYPIVVYPYAYKWSAAGFVQASYAASHRRQDATSIRDNFYPDLTVGCVQTIAERKIQSFDPLTLTLRFSEETAAAAVVAVDGDDASTKSAYFESYLVQGSPYITIKYQTLTPSIKALSRFTDLQLIVSNDNKRRLSDDGVMSVTGTHFIAKTLEGLDWLIASSEPITLHFNTRIPTTITGSDVFTGVLRFACLPTTTMSDEHISKSSNQKESTGLQRLIQHSSVYPTGGNVDWTFRSTNEGRVATLRFDFNTETFGNDEDDTELLMLALPHHAELLSKHVLLESREEFDLSFECIKGRMTAVTGSSWEYDELLLDIGFAEGPGSIVDDKILNDPRVRDSLVHNLQHDVKIALPVLNENIYGYGKQAARLAQLAFIADKLLRDGDDSLADGDELAELLENTVQTLYNVMQSLLNAATHDKLVYDANLGGIVTSDGLENTQADFGNGRYNDHHFHYGYVLYASAVLGKLKPSFVTKYGKKVDALFYDVANDSNVQSSRPSKGAFFPGSRHKLWFDGHSYASGLFAFGNGKSQESSSEAVNCYYGAYLWSLVTHVASEKPENDVSAKIDFARLLLTTEIRGTKKYWHMIPLKKSSTSDSTQMAVYNPAFAKNYMVGNVGMLDAVCTTWFGTNKLYVHMINFIPVTAAAAALFDKHYVRAEYNNVLSSMHEIDEAWRGFVIADHAIIDPNAAWSEAQQLFSPTLDAGLSKTQVLFFIATREGFNVDELSADTSSSTDKQQGTSPSSCGSNPSCADADLVGECCPTAEGFFLGCCSSAKNDGSIKAAEETTTDTNVSSKQQHGTSSSSCSNNPSCADADLVGECCPTGEGFFLGCCAKIDGSIKAAEVVPTTTDADASSKQQEGKSSSSCSSNPSCADADLVGECCPTAEGFFLGCCGPAKTDGNIKVVEEFSTTTDITSSSKQQQGTSSSSCSSNPSCDDADLVGECCPTGEGFFLGCCNIME